jgi:NitT/TauT family transport system substrate-binding protein
MSAASSNIHKMPFQPEKRVTTKEKSMHRVTGISHFIATALLIVSFAGASPGRAKGEEAGLVPIRFAVILSVGQGEIPTTVKQLGLDKKYGMDAQIVDFAVPGQQFNMLRSGAADIASGNFTDLLRQRKAGVAIQAFHSSRRYSNVIITKPASPIKTLTDLKGKKLGEFGPTALDWLILRAAAIKAYGIDLQTDTAELVAGAPPLLNQLLAKDEIDAALQFDPVTLGPVKNGQQRVITDIPTVMKDAGFEPAAFYLQWQITEAWTKAHPGVIDKLYAMIDEAYAKLKSDDDLWPALAKQVGITDPDMIAAYREDARKYENPPYRKSYVQSTQTLLDAVIAIAGEQAVGVTKIDPDAFLFPAGSGT